MNISTTIKQHAAMSFIVFTMGLSFATMLLPVPSESAFLIVASFSVAFPTIVSIVLATLTGGRRGLREFLRQAFLWRTSVIWYGIAILLGASVPVCSVILGWMTGTVTTFIIVTPTVFVLVILLFALLEEIGWRGYAIRHLLQHHTTIMATLIVGIPWGLLHFTLWLVFVPDVSPFAEGLTVFGLSVIASWIYIRSGRSVLVATVEHFAFNASGMLISKMMTDETAIWYYLTCTAVIALILILIDRRLWFTRPEPRRC